MKWHPTVCKRCRLLTGWAVCKVDPYYCISCFDHIDLETGGPRPVGKHPALAMPYATSHKLEKAK